MIFGKSALIGHTGFVGGNLQKQYLFTDTYNSKNINEIAGKKYDLIVCSGISSVKWWANKHPEQDWQGIENLLSVLKSCHSKQFVLISTVDVYPMPNKVDESTDISKLNNHAYGKHRVQVENFVKEHFSASTIIRLPGLFGDGLKKNVIYDLLNDNGLEAINPGSSFQYYFLKHLWSDIQIALEKKISLLNIACEPISTKKIADQFFSNKKLGEKAGPEGHYDMHSRYADLWKSKNSCYQYSAEDVMDDLTEFIGQYR